MAEEIKQERFTRDQESGASYVRFSQEAVAYTVRIEDKDDFFLADYDAAGKVRGVEFLGRRTNAIDYYRSLAAKNSKGPQTRQSHEKRLAG
jgi:uncharacterized protein YuzE